MVAFREYPSLREPLQEELVGSILPNLAPTSQARIPVDEENTICITSSLLLQMLQVLPQLCSTPVLLLLMNLGSQQSPWPPEDRAFVCRCPCSCLPWMRRT